ncbi:MAG: hypothetical protein IT347_12860 [Candidatus Eisenbacteria bacterium]|nr:hypothetical protein [Candidatus Eisenbacteria bacterium]
MKLPSPLHRTLAVALLASTSLLTIAPAAFAGHGHGRYKRIATSRWNGHGQRVVVRESGAAPLVAGLIGGFLLGAAVSNAHSAPVVTRDYVHASPAPRYRYFDPYCGQWFVSLSACREHSWRDGHPAVARVFDAGGGPCLRTMSWSDGSWYDVGDRDWRDRDWRDHDRDDCDRD